jgi:hypothetical protein
VERRELWRQFLDGYGLEATFLTETGTFSISMASSS